MLIGVDFDNTLVCYDELFCRIAVERGLVPPAIAVQKLAVRDFLRASGHEDAWTELQGEVYGARITEAPEFERAIEVLSSCVRRGIPVRIISHKTRYPFRGAPHDLRAAAMSWLRARGFFREDGVGLRPEDVHFTDTKEQKLARIRELGCTHFVDDLPEFLESPDFPANVDRILFDPQRSTPNGDVRRVSSWAEVAEIVFAGSDAADIATVAERLLRSVGVHGPIACRPIAGGANNRVFRAEAPKRTFVVKSYYRTTADPRDRLGAEFGFCRFAWDHGVRVVPEPIAADPVEGVAVYGFVEGTRPAAATSDLVDRAASFYRAVNAHRSSATGLPVAAEACFSLYRHVACIDARVSRLGTIVGAVPVDIEARSFVEDAVVPAWHEAIDHAHRIASELRIDWNAKLATEDRCVSPSDFGLHNALLGAGGDLTFIDFEYAGWDDPAKLVCDFFCQPAVPVPERLFEGFTAAVTRDLADPKGCRDRISVLRRLYQFKWVCILLNEFLPASAARRRFAGIENHDDVRRAQLGKARRALAAVAPSAGQVA